MECISSPSNWAGAREAGHVPVMLEEMVNAVAVDRNGDYVDATFGRGGHARHLLARLATTAKLLVIDRDADAVATARQLACQDSRVRVGHGRFGALREHLDDGAWGRQSGVMLDVGVSSPQIDDSARGFSFDHAGPLDMRMDRRDQLTAATWLNGAPQTEIADVIRRFGEERYASRLAKRIVASRPLQTTTDLKAVVAATLASSRSRAAAGAYARVFQAVRIRVNDELAELDRGLDAAFGALKVGGRVAVITFHSLEHRLVRQRFRRWVEGPALPRRLPVTDAARPVARRVDTVGKGVRPSDAERDANPRARSALLQAVEKTTERDP